MNKSPLRVLLVEDSPSDAQLLEDHLQATAASGFQLTHCQRLRDALDRLKQKDFDVLLLDLSLPDSAGNETFLRARAAVPWIPIIVLTGLDDETLGAEAVRHDIQDYLIKGQADGRQIARAIRYAIERKRAEERLRLQAAALQSTVNAILITDRAGTIQWVNAAFTRLTGYAPAEVIGQNPRLLKSGAQDAAFYEQMWAPILAGQPWRGELLNRRKDGTVYSDEMTIAPLKDAGGEVTHFIAVKQDITERRRMEEALRRAHEELEERVRERTAELVAANAALQDEIARRHSLEAQLVESAEAEQRRIGRDLHDGLCQQLAGIAYLCSVTQQKLAHSVPAEADEVARITRLIEESNSQAHSLTRGLSPVSLAADGLMVALRGLVANLRQLYSLHAHFLCSKPVLVQDNAVATHLYRIAQEALSNAAKHANASCVTLRLAAARGRLTLSVEDNGVGLPASRSGAPAPGMGLETMRFRARAIGAALEIQNLRPQGTLVTCTLPLPAETSTSTTS